MLNYEQLKVMFSLQHATTAQLSSLNFGRTTPWSLYPREIAPAPVVQMAG